MDNVHDIKREKNLNYILPTKYRMQKSNGNFPKEKAAIIIHLHYLDTIQIYLKYMEAIPEDVDIFLTFSDQKVKEMFQETKISRRKNCKIVEKQNRGRDISAFLVACRKDILKYEYICFLHDKKIRQDSQRAEFVKWVQSLWENMIGSTEYIDNILLTFYENPTLGLLVPPFPLTEHFSTFYLNPWCRNFIVTKELAERMGLNADLDVSKPPITLGTVFWVRVSALKKLFESEWKYDDFDDEPRKDDETISHAIERILAYVAQDAGYETGWVITDRYAGEHLEYMQDILLKAFDRLNLSLGIGWIAEIENYEERSRQLREFVNRYEHVYIYGAGSHGKSCLCMLKDMQIKPDAFLVSNKKQNPKVILNIPIYSLSEIDLNEKCGIIVGVGGQYQTEVLQMIKERSPSFSNLYLYRKE